MARLGSCNVTGRAPAGKLPSVARLTQRNFKAIIRFCRLGTDAGGVDIHMRDPASNREGFTHVDSSFFQGGADILSAVVNKEQKRIAMELKK
jgi:hypothetical protein